MPPKATKDVKLTKNLKKQPTKKLDSKVANKTATATKAGNVKVKKEIKKPVKKVSSKNKEKINKSAVTKKESSSIKKAITKVAAKSITSKKVAKGNISKSTVKKDVTSVASKPSVKKEKVLKSKVKTDAKKNSTSKIKSSTVNKTDKINKTTAKKTVPKKPTTKKSVVKKDTKKTSIKKTKKITKITPEYYELPYAYNQTIVKILAQTPNALFIYWDVSSYDRENFIKTYGEDFYNKTRPVLIIRNETKNYSYEVDINDFANSWYLHVGDTMCKYHIELGRRFNEHREDGNNYIYITSSNVIETPNDHILLEKEQHMLYYYNLKTKKITSKNFLTFIKNMGKIYGTYKNMEVEKIHDNPSSGGLNSSGYMPSSCSLFQSGGFYE